MKTIVNAFFKSFWLYFLIDGENVNATELENTVSILSCLFFFSFFNNSVFTVMILKLHANICFTFAASTFFLKDCVREYRYCSFRWEQKADWNYNRPLLYTNLFETHWFREHGKLFLQKPWKWRKEIDFMTSSMRNEKDLCESLQFR